MPLLPAALEVAVYRVAREAIHNVIRHAQATECAVRIEIGREHLTLSVTDNGKGIPHHHQVGVGLHSMRERVTELGGTLTAQPFDGSGTCLTAQFPLEGKD
jgi:signal transduction histidine kinase